MIRAVSILFLLAFITCPVMAEYIETPYWEAKIKAGELPPVNERVPQNPRQIDLSALKAVAGKPGGTLRILMGRVKDLSMMTVYSYTRLVVFDHQQNLVPDLLADFEVEEGRIFTFHLRAGHKWSDGHPFTSEDFRYTWEDVINNKKLSRGPPVAMKVDGKPPRFEVIDDLTVRFSWDAPNPDFLPALALAQPIFLAMPAHYLKQFHVKYQDKDKLAELVKQAKVKGWKNLHTIRARQYRPENPDLPTLDPWRNTTAPPANQLIFERNPYFHRVDGQKHQLPYIDRIEMNIASGDLIAAKTGTGDSDLQGRYLRFDDYTFLKEGEKHNRYKVRLWKTGTGSAVALFPNLNVKDEVLRDLFRDVRVRRALSLAINRQEVNKILYFGLAHISCNTVVPESPLYQSQLANLWTNFDPAKANQLLDAAGLEKRNAYGIRLRRDGKPLEIIVETAGEDSLQTDMLELLSDYWRAIGIKIYPRTSQREVLMSRVLAGLTEMSVWTGFDTGAANADLSPNEIAPSTQYQLEWPQWGLYGESGGEKGEPPILPQAKELTALLAAWKSAPDRDARTKIWQKMLHIYADQVFSIGILNSTLQPVVVSDKLKNVPKIGIWAYNPTAYFGVYMPDTFWFDNQGGEQ